MQTEKRVRLQIGRGRQDQLNVFLVGYNGILVVYVCLLSLGAVLLELAVGRDEAEGLGLGLDDGLCISAEDDDNVKVLNAFMGLFE